MRASNVRAAGGMVPSERRFRGIKNPPSQRERLKEKKLPPDCRLVCGLIIPVEQRDLCLSEDGTAGICTNCFTLYVYRPVKQDFPELLMSPKKAIADIKNGGKEFLETALTKTSPGVRAEIFEPLSIAYQTLTGQPLPSFT
jgi:hypothetical protein